MPLDLAVSIAGRTALVTGGMGGIGRAAVRALLDHGANVAFTWAEGREDPSRAEALAAASPGRASAHPLDLRDTASIEACLEAVLARWGRIDILVNNAAVGSATVAAYAADKPAQDSAMLTINADGALKMAQGYLARMRARAEAAAPLKLINISSVGGGVAVFPGFRLSDGMSKAAVAFMTCQLAAELTGEPVDVFALCPGATDTPMFQASTLSGMSEDQRRHFTAALPKQRLIAPEEIAALIVFLASAHSAPLHGAVLDASMGLGVRPGLMSEYAGH
jgi:NAD(P)-dependent dehydrogenase (short-subunit alcohol dehydrogenase family)